MTELNQPSERALEWVHRGFAQLQQSRPAQSLGSFERAIQLDPGCIEALLGSTSALLHLGRPRQALPFCDRALQLRPDIAEVQANCAAVLLALKRAKDALPCAEQASRLKPDLFQAQFNRAEALRALQRHDEALQAYERTLILRAGFAPAFCGLGQACREMGDEVAARAAYQRALDIEPDNAAARFGLLFSTVPMIPGDDAAVEQSRRAFTTELGRFESWVATHEALNETLVASMTPSFYLAYQERSNKELLMRCGSVYARLLEQWAALRKWPVASTVSPDDGRIRVGIVTAHVHEHSVFHALVKGWIGHLDPARVRISVFRIGVTQDAATTWVGERAELVECSDRSLAECVLEILGRRLDVLLYPEIGMDPTTLQLASLGLARHQVAAWGHPETSGLPTIDYYLSAAAFEPPLAEQQYSEVLLKLPNLGCYYEPLGITAAALDPATLGIVPGVPLLLCAGTPYKYAAEHDALLVDIARELGRCQIVLFAGRPRALSARLLARIQAKFRAAGLDPLQYLVLVPWLSQELFFGLMRQATVYLDSPGFSGFNTVMQAVECELPVVAYEGKFMRGRFASGIMRQMGLDELVTNRPEQYLAQVLRLARDVEFRDGVRARLRAERDGLYRDRSAIAALQEFMDSLTARVPHP